MFNITHSYEEFESLRAEVEHKSLLLHHLCDQIKNPRHAGIWNAQTMEAIDVVNGLRAEVERLTKDRDSLRALLMEWHKRPPCETEEDWIEWVEDFGVRVAAALGAAR